MSSISTPTTSGQSRETRNRDIQSRPTRSSHTQSPTSRQRKRRVEPIFYFFLVPSLILFTLAITVPGVIGIFFSFTDSIGIGDWEFIGLTNYIAIFSDPAILQSYLFTFGFSIVTVIAVNVVAFLLAVGLTSRIRMKSALRTIFVIPMVISGIIIAYVFNFLFSNSLPSLGAAAGIPWLGEHLSPIRTSRGSRS